MTCDPHQVEAAKQDNRLLVLPPLWDGTPVDTKVIEKYTSMGATTGMSLAQLLATLVETDPIFGQSI
jgi:hypothetical protein